MYQPGPRDPLQLCPEGYFDNPDRYKEQPQRDENTVTAEILLNYISRMEKLPPAPLPTPGTPPVYQAPTEQITT